MIFYEKKCYEKHNVHKFWEPCSGLQELKPKENTLSSNDVAK